MCRCFALYKTFAKEFIVEAMSIIANLQNIVTFKSLVLKTPFEKWYGVKTNVEHLKIYCMLCTNSKC